MGVPGGCVGGERSGLLSLGIWLRCGGRGVWSGIGCGRSRIVGWCLVAWGECCSRRGNGCSASRRVVWATCVRERESWGGVIRSTLAIARAVVEVGIDEFPVAYLNG